jgi:hypothetical protein
MTAMNTLGSDALKPIEYSPNPVASTKAYERYKSLYRSGDPRHKSLVKRANEEFRAKAYTGTIHTDKALSNISLMYGNGAYIGEMLLPRVDVGDGNLSGIYYVHDKRSRLAYPDDELGARGSPNELNQAVSTATYSCKWYGYKEYVDQMTISAQDAPLNALADATQNLAEAIAFRRELRIATIMTTTGNYSGNTVALAAGARWDVAGGDPIGAIQAARAAIWSGRGPGKLVGFTSLDVANVLTRHAAFLDIFKYNSSGLVPMSAVANWLGLDEIVVSEARKDTANPGQTASYSRIWPTNFFGIVRVATSPSIRNAAFGYTFHAGPPATAQWFDQTLGPKGGYYAKNAVCEDHRVVAGDAGYLLTTVIG